MLYTSVTGMCVRNRMKVTIMRFAQLRMILPQVHLRKPCYDFYFL